MKICDLHTHSNFSDGTLTPTELLNKAVECGLSAVALCDHNTVGGLLEFKAAAQGKDIEAVLGSELTTEYDGVELHILGLFIDETAFTRLEAFCDEMNTRKGEANKKMVEALNRGGYDIDYNRLVSATPNGHINRAHVAAEMVRKGYVESVKLAFKTVLKAGGDFYTPPERLDSIKTIEFLRSIGAVPIIAHPFFSAPPKKLESFWLKARSAGLVGMETLYPMYDEKTTEIAIKTAEKYGFLQSGGSDFHGETKPHISLGTGTGNLCVPYEVFFKLKEFKLNNF